ncbi:GNAT family N-acetyltransferase [Fictibacillus sp. 5RED26]|uniref:GNAT family N-acetyltransferase n=1 Tax=Fictibacillus sp. 5RED26 TaxID=2745876 RepID=UPI0018CE1C44|nr:GNAT family N-acetyltransferase [Fictibacillus sp. 5RED26]MBH0156995.1 GNAT family N-acetyltransferase [Fictibacillus sp. 5RED26]
MEFMILEGMPEKFQLKQILQLHEVIFGASNDDLLFNMKLKNALTIVTAIHHSKVVGYKMGYEIDHNTYYSWLGGVDPVYRGQGVASNLMKQQHEYLKMKGYSVVRTKTMNKWRNMLLLNIKNGFDVMETYTNKNGLHKIVLEKKLCN